MEMQLRKTRFIHAARVVVVPNLQAVAAAAACLLPLQLLPDDRRAAAGGRRLPAALQFGKYRCPGAPDCAR